MRITTLSESKNQTIDEIIASLIGKTLIVFNVKTTSISPHEKYSQIISIAAVAIDASSGEEIGSFDDEIALGLIVFRQIDLEDRAAVSGDWEDMTVRDWLNAADYDMEESDSKPDELNVLLRFKAFVDNYDQAVLVVHNASFAMRHLNAALPVPIKGVRIIDTLQFIRTYFDPILRVLMLQGSKQATEMSDKVGDFINPTLHNLGRALQVAKIQRGSNSIQEVRQLSGIFSAMIHFLHKHRKLFDDPEYKSFAAGILSRDRYPTD
jgi:hypothetical protein